VPRVKSEPVRVQLLGSFEVAAGRARLGDVQLSRRRRSASLIKLLSLTPAHALHRDQVLEALWPELTPEAGRNELYKHLSFLRSALRQEGFKGDLVALRGSMVKLVERVGIDVDDFRCAAARALEEDPSACEAALRRYCGDLLPADLYEAWSESAREDLRGLRRRLLRRLVESCAAQGAWGRAAETLRSLPDNDLDEELTRARMRVYVRAGDLAGATAEYDRCKEALRRELDASPAPETEALYEAITSSDGSDVAAWTARVETALVGRAREMTLLRKALAEARSGSGGIVLVTGEPGIGKTRLVLELLEHAALNDCQAGLGGCPHEESAVPYRPWIEALEPLLRTLSDGDLAACASAAGADMGQLFPGLRDRFPSATNGVARAGDRARSSLFDGVSRLIRVLAARSPILLVLEDLHDADAATLSLLTAVARDVSRRRVLLVLTARSTEDAGLRRVVAALAWAGLKANIRLGNLTDDEIGEYARRLIETDLPAGALAALSRESGGNPLYARELARFVAGAGARLDVAGLHVPVSVQGVVLSRLEALSAACVEVLNAAAVVGHRFETQLVGRVAEFSPERSMDALNEAVLAGIVRPVDERLLTFEFTHDLVRRALYSQLAYVRRAELHRSIAEAIESMSRRGERVEELAYHFEAAIPVGGDVEKAIGYATRAGELARAKCAWDEAEAHWRRALQLMDQGRADPEEEAGLVERLADLLFGTGSDYPAAVAYLERALRVREEQGQAERAAQIHSRLGVALSTHIGEAKYAKYMDISLALHHYRAAEEVLSQGEERPALGYFYTGLASAAFNGVRVDEGLEASSRGMQVAERLGMGSLLASATLLHGALLKAKGRLAESRDLLTRAYAIGDARNDPLVTYYTVTNIADWTEGYVAGSGHLYRRELEKQRFASADAQRTGLLQDLGCALCRCGRIEEAQALGAPGDGFLGGMLHFCNGEWAETERIWREGFELLAAVGHRSAYANQSHHLANLCLARLDIRGAERLLREELAIGAECGGVLIELRSRIELALICAEDGRLEEAREHVERARGILANGEDWGSRAARLAMAQGALAAADGDGPGADAHFASAQAWFNRAELAWDEADAYCHWARRGAQGGGLASERKLRAAAEAIYRRIGVGPAWLERTKMRPLA
jgi:DNA-binding SARP family transcriptional activator